MPAPGNRVHFGIEGEEGGQCSSLISFESATGEFTSDIHFDPIDGDIAAVAADGRYKMVAQFLPGGNEIGSTRMAKAVRLRVYSGSSILLRSFFFRSQWSVVNERNQFIDDSLGVEATFHPSLPIVAWKFSYFKMGFWLADLREDSSPIFIDGLHSPRTREKSIKLTP